MIRTNTRTHLKNRIEAVRAEVSKHERLIHLSLHGSATTQPVIGVRKASVVILGVLTLMMVTDAHALQRFRCIPADGGASYTSPGTCKSSTDTREPLTEQEMAESQATENRGRAFIRCTAADGSYSKFVFDGECPSASDKRTVEYAKQPIQTTPQSSPPPAPAATPLSPPATPAPISAVPAPLASAPATVTSTVTPARSGTGWMAKFGLVALAAMGIWGVFRWLGRRRDAAQADQREERAKAFAQKRSNPEPGKSMRQAQPMAQRSDMQQKAEAFLAALDAGADVPGGFAFRGALQQSRPDYSMESLDRIDQLLSQVRAKFSPQREGWQSGPATDNFCVMLAFYLGAVISRQSKQTIHWYTREQAAPLMPADMPLPEANWARLVGIIAASACVPLGVIEDALFGNSPGMTCKAYVEHRLSKLPKPAAKDENERCTLMLDAFFNDAGIMGGLAFRDQLKLAQLDHSLSSLERLDKLLRSIRAEIKPTYKEFVNNTDTQNFVRLVAFYIGMTTARAGAMSVKWLDFSEAKKDLPELEFQFETTSICLLGGRFYFPLGLVTEILLQPDPRRSLPVWASEALKFAPPPMPSILRSSAQTDLASPLDDKWALAMRQAGFVAAWSMFAVEGGATGAPMVFVPGEGEKGTFRDFKFYDTVESATEAANGLMETNPDNAPFQVMSFDGYANLHTGRTDALTIELRIYAAGQASKQDAFNMRVVCPYRNANDPKGFAIFSPKLLECSAAKEMHSAIFKHFYLGVGKFKVNDFEWFKYLDERI